MLLLQASKSVHMLGKEIGPCLHPLEAEAFACGKRWSPKGLDMWNGHEPAVRGKADTHSTAKKKWQSDFINDIKTSRKVCKIIKLAVSKSDGTAVLEERLSHAVLLNDF